MTGHFHARTGENPGSLDQRILIVGIIGITLLGFYLRYRCLGCLGFRWDEDLTSLAVKALLDKGVPELPSGMIYLRFYPYQWIVAASVKTFGFSEFSMRLPAVIFGTILIPVAYWVSAKLVNKQVGLIVAACIALSFWQVEISRTARMYAPFFLVYLLAAYAIFRAYYQNPDRVFSPWVIPLALLALSIHQLAYSLAIIVLLAIPLRNSAARTTSLLLQAIVIGIAFIALKSFQDRYFNIARGVTEDGDTGPLGAMLQQISIPEFSLFSQAFDAFPAVIVVASATVLLSAAWAISVTRDQSISYRILVVVAIGLSLIHQFNLVVLTLAMMLISLKGGVRAIRSPVWYRPAIICISMFFLWLAAVAIISTSYQTETAMASPGFRKSLRALVDYPNFRLFWSYVLERPLLSLPLALGTLWGIEKLSRDRPDATALFLVGGFWSVLFVNGVLQTKFEFFRYNLQLDPVFLMLVAVGLYAVPDLLDKLGISVSEQMKSFSTRRVYSLAVATIAIAGVAPAAAVLTSARDYTETSFPYTILGLDRYDDFKTPAAYVRDRLQDDDIVLVLAPREYWNYIGRVDFWLWSNHDESQTYQEEGRARDLYLGVPVLQSVKDVSTVLSSRNGGNAWILYSRARLARTPWISADLKAYLQSLDDRIVYTGRDGQTVVVELTD